MLHAELRLPCLFNPKEFPEGCTRLSCPHFPTALEFFESQAYQRGKPTAEIIDAYVHFADQVDEVDFRNAALRVAGEHALELCACYPGSKPPPQGKDQEETPPAPLPPV